MPQRMSEPTALRIIFAGTPDFSVPPLRALLDAGQQIVAVYTQPDRPAGRGKKLTASPVKLVAEQQSLPICQPASLKPEEQQSLLAEFGADIMVVVAYGLLLPLTVLDTPRLGCINVHGSLLPRWRGAAPIQRALWAGDSETGITIMQMDEGLDTGDMLLLDTLPIEPNDTSASLYEKLAEVGPHSLVKAVAGLASGSLAGQKQDQALATYAKKLSKAEAQIDWRQDAEFIERCVRAFNPWPVSYFSLQGNNHHQDQNTNR